MFFFKRLGLQASNFAYDFVLFFVFIGHLCHSCKQIIVTNEHGSWFNMVKILYYSGAAIVIPLTIISSLLGVSISLSTYNIFNHFNLQGKAIAISQDILIDNLLPLLVGFVLCVQSSLNIINARIKITKFRRSVEEVMLEYVLPIIIGTLLTALLLFTYTFLAVMFSLYITFSLTLSLSAHEFLMRTFQNITLIALFSALMKTLGYCTIVSFTAGYYYYQMAITHMHLRKAVSRIFTRGFLGLASFTVYCKFMHF